LKRSLVSLFAGRFVIQISSPTITLLSGESPAGNVPRFAPSLALSFVTVPGHCQQFGLRTQIFVPSKLILTGCDPTGKTSHEIVDSPTTQSDGLLTIRTSPGLRKVCGGLAM